MEGIRTVRTIARAGALLAFVTLLQAHVSVTPGEVAAGASTRWVVRVPSEREEATVQVRVELPKGLGSPRPMTKPGWRYEIERDTAGVATAITWSGGQIPAGEFDEFVFTARAPSTRGPATFASHQTYASGDVIAWVGAAGGPEPAPAITVHDSSFVAGAPPARAPATVAAENPSEGVDLGALALGISVLALAVAVVGLRRGA